MATFDLEYSICQIQSGQFSMAAKSHRQEGGDPQLHISMLPGRVEWRLTDLEHGVPETIAGQPRRDRVDFYFRHEVFKQAFTGFPAPRAPSNPAYRFEAKNSQGFERPGGIGIRMLWPVWRFSPVAAVRLFSQQPPAFEGSATDATLHLDMESGPARIYRQEIFEVHFGIEAAWEIRPLHPPVPSEAVLIIADPVYATIHAELASL